MQTLVLHFQLLQEYLNFFRKATRNKKKRHNNIFMLARSKLNSTESKISEALINNEISHEGLC